MFAVTSCNYYGVFYSRELPILNAFSVPLESMSDSVFTVCTTHASVALTFQPLDALTFQPLDALTFQPLDALTFQPLDAEC